MRMCIDPYSCVHHALHSITEAMDGRVWRDLSIPLTEASVQSHLLDDSAGLR
jgi:hypothetical protein